MKVGAGDRRLFEARLECALWLCLFGLLLTAWLAFHAFGARLAGFASGFDHAIAAAHAIVAEARSCGLCLLTSVE